MLSRLLLALLCVSALSGAQSDAGKPVIQLRLGGEKRKHYEGRVEVFYNGEWGTVCDDDFSISAAQVVCRELGFMDAVSWAPSAKFGRGEGRIWLDNVHCTGTEKSLAECESNGFGVSDCKHSEDVGVVCSQKRIPGFKFIRNQVVGGERENTLSCPDYQDSLHEGAAFTPSNHCGQWEDWGSSRSSSRSLQS